MGESHQLKSPRPPCSPNEKQGRQAFPSGVLGFQGLSRLRGGAQRAVAWGLVAVS